MLISFSPTHAFYYLSPVLLTHSLFLGVVLSSLVPLHIPHTWSSSFRYIVYFAFLSQTTILCLRKCFSFTRSSCTSVTLICSPQLNHWQLLLMTDVSQWTASLHLAPSLHCKAPRLFLHLLFTAAFSYRCSKITFSWSTASLTIPGPPHYQDQIPAETAWEELQTMLSSGVSKHGWHFALGVLLWTVTACQCIISLPNIHSRSSGLECADKLSSYQP